MQYYPTLYTGQKSGVWRNDLMEVKGSVKDINGKEKKSEW